MMKKSKSRANGEFCYAWPRPAVTVDIALLYPGAAGLEVLVIRRGREPWRGRWALPGGYVDEFEPLEQAAIRELKEETGIEGLELRQIGAFGDPGRDPRGHTISIAYGSVLPARLGVTAGDDAEECQWVTVAGATQLAFDHTLIVRRAVEALLRDAD